MELKQVFLTLIKILISTGLLVRLNHVEGAALMGGHIDNKNQTEKGVLYDDYDYTDSEKVLTEKTIQPEIRNDSEEIPNPSPLVLPGYNLPENIFNHGKPFYVEKDPVTGNFDFSHKSPSASDDELYDYVSEETSDDIYDKKNIDRKDGSIASFSSHKQADVNQLTPNFHDFLNLPVKYNPDKYVYPLISSSYASTKIQGSVNKFHNHKDTFGVQKTTTTKRPNSSPSYYHTTSYYTPRTTQRTMATTRVTTTTTTRPTTVKRYPELTTTPANLLHSAMSHPSFNEEYEYYDSPSETTTVTTKKPKPQDAFLTTQSTKDIHLTTKGAKTNYLTSTSSPVTTTKRILSLFEQLFGDYDETVTTTTTIKPTKPTSLFLNLPYQKLNKTTTTTEAPKTEKPIVTTTKVYYTNIHAGPHTNVLSGGNMGLDENYEYSDEDDYNNDKIQDNIAVENKVYHTIDDSLRVEPLKPVTKLTLVNKTISEEKTKLEKKPTSDFVKNKPFNVKPTNYVTTYYGDVTQKPKISPSTTTTTKFTTTTTRPTTTSTTTTPKPKLITSTTTTTKAPTSRVTSLPLGENHFGAPSLNRDPIIVATQNLREKLNSEKVRPEAPQLIVELPPQPPHQKPITQLVPSTSNIHIAPDQDTVSFVVGHHQSVGDGGQYVGTSLKESPFDDKPFRPLYGHEATYSSNSDTNKPQTSLKLPSLPEVAGGSSVTIQPLQNSEASLAIGIPVNGIKQVPGQVMDASLEHDGHVQFPQESENKVVFPENNEQVQSNIIPPNLEIHHPPPLPAREVLKLNSKPMYHQLPSDLTPPKENDIVALPPRYGPTDRPVRPPWDPRPGHFYSGKPEYARPPRPPPDVAYKRIDNLPNILPQFRPNNNHLRHHPPSHTSPSYPPLYYDQRLNRQPLLERPSNRPIGFFEKLMPPPPPPPPQAYHMFHKKTLPRSPTHIPHDSRIPLIPQSLSSNIEERTSLGHPPSQSLEENQTPMAEDRIMNVDPRKPQELLNNMASELSLYQTPPNIQISNRRNGDSDVEVETLQMIQAKNEKGKDGQEDSEPLEVSGDTVRVTAQESDKDSNSDKTIYKVYPVNTAPLKLDAIDADQKAGVVIGTRADSPLPPSKIDNDFNYELQDRHDAPILKPHSRPPSFPIKSDFPYPLERPDSFRNPDSNNNRVDDISHDSFVSNNQWNTINENIESRIVNGGKTKFGSNQISATLKTYTEKPIAIAYTPTEPNLNADKYSMPNYGSPVIPEIRPGSVENVHTPYGSKDSEITVHATMHTNPNILISPVVPQPTYSEPQTHKFNHKIDTDMDSAPIPAQQDFQAPFQASMKLDAPTNSQGWSVVRDKNRTTPTEETEATTLQFATPSEFDIENFKPELIGGFKPLYSMPEAEGRTGDEGPEREEK